MERKTVKKYLIKQNKKYMIFKKKILNNFEIYVHKLSIKDSKFELN